jgi:two-component system cell cycle sensor histidine kinase/response regulator CckA
MTLDDESLSALLAPQLTENLFRHSADAVCIMGLDGAFIDVNDVLTQRLSTTRAELLGTRFQTAVAAAESRYVQDQFDRAAAGETVRFEATGVDATGQTFRAGITNFPLRLDGEIVAVLGVARDIGPVEKAAQSRVELEQRFEQVLATITDGIFFIDNSWTCTYVNPNGEVIAGLTSSEILGRSIWEVVPGTIRSLAESTLRSAMNEQRTITSKSYSEDDDLWFETTAYPSPSGVALHVRDVTSAAAQTARSHAAEKRLTAQAALLEIARDAISVRSLDGIVSYWNAAAAELYEWPAEQAVGISVHDLIHSRHSGVDEVAHLGAYDAAHATVLREGYWAGELEQFTQSGRRLTVNCRWSVVHDDDGKPESILAVSTDITDRTREQERRLRTMRMESLGNLAGGIAHDLNNILTPMLMSVQLLAEDETDSVNLEILKLHESGVKRGADMVRQVLSFARGVESRKVRVDTTQLITDLDAFARNTVGVGIVVETTIDEALSPVRGDPTQLMQVLTNFVTNARDAMPEGGVLSIAARVGDDQNAVIDVSDTGEGMTEVVLANIFEPFFTTKPPGVGTGLGLATSATIVDNHNATIAVTSSPGSGTTFSLVFPEATFTEDETSAGFGDAVDLPPKGHGQRILVVDDELAIRTIAKHALENNGYKVVLACDGGEALVLIEAYAEAFDLVFTDMTMPVVGGTETAEAVHAHHPHIPLLAASGYTLSDEVDLAKTAGISQFLPKPYTTAELLWAVHSAITSVRKDT